jgi:hypothetical protein
LSGKLGQPLAPELTATIATVESLRRGVCKWPIGTPKTPEFGFCGRPSGISNYCTFHAGRAYRAPVIVVSGKSIKDSWL